MVTRPEDPHDPLAEQLGRLGAEVIVQPAIRIAPPADWRPVDAALARLHEFDWLVFSSANGVRYLLDRLRETGTQPVRLREDSCRREAPPVAMGGIWEAVRSLRKSHQSPNSR